MAELGEAQVAIRANFDKFDSDVKGQKSKLDKVLGGIATGATVAIGAGIAGAGVAVTKFTSDSVKEFASFQQGMNEVFTLLPGITQEAMDKMSDDVLAFSKDMGVLPEKVVPALYQAISAGVPTDNVFSFLETAQKAAVGGVTDLEVSVDGISSVMNAYGADVISATEASDLMFTAVKDGKTTFDELSGSLFQVLPTASSIGVEFGDVTAALAAMTAQGVPTSVATTQLRQLLVELTKDGSGASDMFKEISGQTFPEFVAAGGDVQGALQLMDEKAADSGTNISNLFSSVEAGNAALALTGGGAETFTKNLSDMENSAGATTAAFGTMEGGIGRSQERAAALWSTIQIGVGQALEPLLTKLIELGEDALPYLMGIFEEAKPVIEAFATEFGEKLGPALETIVTNTRRIAEALGLTNDEMTDAEVFAALLGKAFDALIIILDALVVASDAAAFVFENFGPAIKNMISPVWGLVNGIQALIDQFNNLEIPDWFTPGSPTPLEMGIRGINSALNGIPDFSSKFNIEPSFGGLTSGGGSSNVNHNTTVNVGSVSATSMGGNPADDAIRMTVQLLGKYLQVQGA
jgi:TP901 family phage tail tape measure protein